MFAEFVFTPTESKYLIAKAIAGTDRVQKALKDGIIAIHPSTTGFALFHTLTGRRNAGKVWVTGMIVEKGLCIERNTQIAKKDREEGKGIGNALADPGLYPHTMVLYKGREMSGWTINELADRMGPGDIYVKGVNAIDISGKVGVLLGSLAEGTIGKMLAAREKKGFEILCPVGYEKLIPVPVETAAAFISQTKDYSMGQKVRMRPLDATVVTEVDALKMLSGVEEAVMFAAGGVGGGEGSVCLAVSGTEEQIRRAIESAESVKGIQFPEIHSPVCMDCVHPTCHLAGQRKAWTVE